MRIFLPISLTSLLLSLGLLLLTATGTWTPAAQAQTATDTTTRTDHLAFLPLIQNAPVQWATQTKSRSGIHLGNRSTDWRDQNQQSTFLNQIGRTSAGVWPAAVVVLSDQLYTLHRFDPLCQVSGATVKQSDGKEYELFRYLTEGVRNHNLKVVIRLSPSPGNFSDYDNPGSNHLLLTTEAPPNGQDYCGDSNAKTKQYRDILDLAKEMRAIYTLNKVYDWPTDSFFFEPANEPNQEWYQRHVDNGIANLAPKVDNKQAWIEMDDYFAALYERAIALQPNLQILSPSMSQELYGEHYRLGSCDKASMLVVGGNGRTGLDFMKKVYGYDIGIDAFTTPKADGFVWHNYWREGQEMWEPPLGLTPTLDPICAKDNQYKPYSDHFFQYLSGGMQQSMQPLPTFITEADLQSPCQNNNNPLPDKDAFPYRTRDSLRKFIEQEYLDDYGLPYGAQYVIVWLLVNQYPDEESSCKNADNQANANYEINWHEAYLETGTQREWFGLWWSATP